MKIPKWNELGITIQTLLEDMGYDGFLPTDENSLRHIIQELLEYSSREALYFLEETGTFDTLGNTVFQNIKSCLKVSDGIYDERVVLLIAELYRRVGKLQVAGLLFMSVRKVAEAKRCFDAAPKMLKSAQPISPWALLEEHGFSEADCEEIVKCLYYHPCPEPIRDLFLFKKTTQSHWKTKVSEGLGLKWVSESSHFHLGHEEICRLHKLAAEFSEPGSLEEHERWREKPLPNLLLLVSGNNVRADTVCFACGEYELAIQWAIAYLQLDLDWFDSGEHVQFALCSEVQKDVALYFEFAGDYHSAISWCENHNIGSPRDFARLRFLIGNVRETVKQLERPKSDFGGFYYGNELRVANMLSGIKRAGEVSFHCRKCGAVLMRHWKLCPECQTPAVLTCKCGEKIESHWTACPTCGAKLA